MSLRFHEIAESGHRILNPLTDDKLNLLGEICDFAPGTRILDLACGKESSFPAGRPTTASRASASTSARYF
ncbi:hypothetical protein ACFQQB_00515 [Nonomuraea rubra]|uniref:hypothetical protein n=1 Tax=Nonomuraea rubra TaxID=46180 RepID=UPI003618FBE1